MQMAEATFGSRALNAHRLGMMIQVSSELVKDAGVDMSTFLSEAFAEQFASPKKMHFSMVTA